MHALSLYQTVGQVAAGLDEKRRRIRRQDRRSATPRSPLVFEAANLQRGAHQMALSKRADRVRGQRSPQSGRAGVMRASCAPVGGSQRRRRCPAERLLVILSSPGESALRTGGPTVRSWSPRSLSRTPKRRYRLLSLGFLQPTSCRHRSPTGSVFEKFRRVASSLNDSSSLSSISGSLPPVPERPRTQPSRGQPCGRACLRKHARFVRCRGRKDSFRRRSPSSRVWSALRRWKHGAVIDRKRICLVFNP